MPERWPQFFCRETLNGWRVYDGSKTEPYDDEERRLIAQEQGWSGPYTNVSTAEFPGRRIHGGTLPEDEARWMAEDLNQGTLTVEEAQEAIDGP